MNGTTSVTLAALDSAGRDNGEQVAAARPRRLIGRVLASRGLLSILDQAVYSGSNFATSVLIGRLGSREDLGVYALAISVVMLVRGMQAELVNSPYTIYCNRREGAGLASYRGSSLVHHLFLSGLGVVLLSGLSLGLPTLVADLGPVFLVLVVALPFLLLREHLRQLSMAHLQVGPLLAVDLIVAGLQVGALLLLGAVREISVPNVYMVIGTACAVGCLRWFQTSTQPMAFDPKRFAPDWKENWSFGKWTLAGFLVGSTTPFVMPWVVAAAHGEAATGLLAACNTIVNLSGMYVTGVTNLLTPQAASAYVRGGLGDLRRVLRNAAILFVVTLGAFTLFVWLSGDLLTRLVYGSRYEGTAAILVLLALTTLVNSLGITAGNGLWALGKPQANFAADVCTLVVTLAVVFALIQPLGVLGAALATLAGTVTGACVRCLTLLRLMREEGAAPAAVGKQGATP